MALEYRHETKVRVRMVILAGAPFSGFIGFIMASLSGVFSGEAFDLVASIFRGDMTRIGDFLGYVAIVICFVVIPIILVSVCFYCAVLKPDHVINIDPDRRVVTVDFDPPWRKPYRSTYRFDEIDGIELKYDDDNEILLHLPDRKWPLTLLLEFRYWAAEQKYKRLVELGLPSR